MDKFPACFDQNIGMNFGKNTHTPAGGAARYASTRRFALKSQELTDIQVDIGIVKDLKRNKYMPIPCIKHLYIHQRLKNKKRV